MQSKTSIDVIHYFPNEQEEEKRRSQPPIETSTDHQMVCLLASISLFIVLNEQKHQVYLLLSKGIFPCMMISQAELDTLEDRSVH